MSLTSNTNYIDRQIKNLLRAVDVETLSREEKEQIRKLKLACNELKLDVRDYEYAQTREEQLKWSKVAKHNLCALESLVLRLHIVFGPADVAELGAEIDTLKVGLV